MANTLAPLSETAVCNMAANTLDAKRLESLDDSGSFARFCRAEFGYLRDEFLALYPYAFAKEYAKLPETTAPAYRWKAAYNLPANCVRVLEITRDGSFNGELIKYERVGRQIRTNLTGTLFLPYIKRVTNLALWDPLPARALGQYIALQAAQRITGKMGYIDKANQALHRATWNAQQIDSLERGTPEDVNEADILVDRRTYSDYYDDITISHN